MRNFLHRKARSHRLHNQHACVCSPETEICRCFVHLVFAVTPSQFTNTLIGGGTYAMNSSRLAGRDMKSERHLITGVCNCNATSCDYATCDNTTGVAQMWNWGFEEIVPLESLSNKTICPSVWIKDLTAGGTSTMQLPCLPMPVTMLPKAALGSSNSAINAFSSSATRIRNEETGLTRNNLHIVFTAAPEDPTHYLVGGGMYSYDGGASWDSKGTAPAHPRSRPGASHFHAGAARLPRGPIQPAHPARPRGAAATPPPIVHSIAL